MAIPSLKQSESFDRIDQSKQLWEKVLLSGYLDADTYDRAVDRIRPMIADIRNFLKTEQAKYEDRPNTAHSLALLLISLPLSGQEELRKSLSLAFLEKGLSVIATKTNKWQESDLSSEQPVIELALDDITAAIEKDGRSCVARTGPYSSIYAALLALLLDEITIREQLDSLGAQLEDLNVANQLTGPVMKPGPILLTTYYRGQRCDWTPIPKALRDNPSSKNPLERLYRLLREIVAEARFGAGISRLNLPHLSKLQLDAIRQHYGFPTSLLDLTTNIEVAAFFATQNADPGHIGVIYRYHLAHPYALDFLGRCIADVDAIGGMEMAQYMKEVAVKALKGLKIVQVEGVERICRQEGVFVQGVGLWAVHNFLQPVYFRQHDNLAYANPEHKIHEDWLLPKDDPIEKIAARVFGVEPK